MGNFSFSDQLLDDLERIQGTTTARRGKVDHADNRRLAAAMGGSSGGYSMSRPARNLRALKIMDRTTRRVPQVVVKISSRLRGTSGVLGAFAYQARISFTDREPLALETSEGKMLSTVAEMRELANEWHMHELSGVARRQGATAIAMVFSMPAGTDAEKVLGAVRDFAETDLTDHRWAMTLHTDEPHPHVHLIVANRDNLGCRFNPDRAFLTHARERFAENLRERGIEADATRRMTRAYPDKGERADVRKMIERGVVPASTARQCEALDAQTAESQAHLKQRRQARSRTATNVEEVRDIYARAVAELDAYDGRKPGHYIETLRRYAASIREPASPSVEIAKRLMASTHLMPLQALSIEARKQIALARMKASGERLRSATENAKRDALKQSREKSLGPYRQRADTAKRILEKTIEQEVNRRRPSRERDRDRDRERDGPSR